MSTFLLIDAVEPPKPKTKAAVHIEPPPNVYTEIVQEESNAEPELGQTPEWFILPGDGVSLNESAKVIFAHIGQLGHSFFVAISSLKLLTVRSSGLNLWRTFASVRYWKSTA